MNQPVLMLCPECKKKYSRQVAVKILMLREYPNNVWFKVRCEREGHVSLFEIAKAG